MFIRVGELTKVEDLVKVNPKDPYDRLQTLTLKTLGIARVADTGDEEPLGTLYVDIDYTFGFYESGPVVVTVIVGEKDIVSFTTEREGSLELAGEIELSITLDNTDNSVMVTAYDIEKEQVNPRVPETEYYIVTDIVVEITKGTL